MKFHKTAYLAGKMRGIPKFNFPAFDAAAKDLREQGWEIISPADIDREHGFDPEKHDESYFPMNILIRRDIEAVLKQDAIILLPGWEKSVGANAELAVAKWAGKPAYLYPSMVLLEEESVLLEAERLTHGARQNQYGPPDQDFKRVADAFNAMKGTSLKPSDVAEFMVLMKMSRNQHQHKRDNWVDMAGYAGCGSRCRD